jgi:hypothetical protein
VIVGDADDLVHPRARARPPAQPSARLDLVDGADDRAGLCSKAGTVPSGLRAMGRPLPLAANGAAIAQLVLRRFLRER